MKRIAAYTIIALTLCSCVLEKDNRKSSPLNDKSSLEYISTRMFSQMVSFPLSLVSDIDAKDNKALFAENYHKVIRMHDYNQGTLEITKDPSRDSTWTAHGIDDSFDYIITIHMKPRDEHNLPGWECTSAGTYDEGDGFSAKFETTDVCTYSWIENKSGVELSYSMIVTASYRVETFSEGKSIQSMSNSFKNKDFFVYY